MDSFVLAHVVGSLDGMFSVGLAVPPVFTIAQFRLFAMEAFLAVLCDPALRAREL